VAILLANCIFCQRRDLARSDFPLQAVLVSNPLYIFIGAIWDLTRTDFRVALIQPGKGLEGIPRFR
jgi:hypothetical protein